MDADTAAKELPKKFTIRDYETLKVVADPLRAQIMELLIFEPATVRQVAERLGLAPSKLYYHFGLLEKIGLIEVVETRMVANMVEKQYGATAAGIEVDPALLVFSTPEGKENIQTLLSTTLDTTREDILRSLQARQFNLEQGDAPRPRRLILNRLGSRLPEARADEFGQRVEALLREFAEADLGSQAGADDQTYAMTVAFYPSFYFRDNSAGG
jgi:DNA-binding transcriptional ArsR family regulator